MLSDRSRSNRGIASPPSPSPFAALASCGVPFAAPAEGRVPLADWSISAAIVAASPRPVFLAGGLHADNIAEAWQRVRPFGFDLCSGAREHGRMSRARLTAFFDAVAALR